LKSDKNNGKNRQQHAHRLAADQTGADHPFPDVEDVPQIQVLLRQIQEPEERLFWTNLAVGCAFWLVTLVGIAIGQHRLGGVSESLMEVFGGRAVANLDARKARVTIRDLLTMTSGLDCHFGDGERTLSQMMGSADSEPGRNDDEYLHRVSISQLFYIGQHEVTQAEWTKVMGVNPSSFNGCVRCPVEQVDFYQVNDSSRASTPARPRCASGCRPRPSGRRRRGARMGGCIPGEMSLMAGK
jgi:hypothetical protein